MLAERVATHRGLISGVATRKKPFVSGVAWRGVAWTLPSAILPLSVLFLRLLRKSYRIENATTDNNKLY